MNPVEIIRISTLIIHKMCSDFHLSHNYTNTETAVLFMHLLNPTAYICPRSAAVDCCCFAILGGKGD